MTLRFSGELADALEAIAEIERTAVVEVMRLAAAAYIEQRRQDPEFQERLRAADDRRQLVLDKLRSPRSEPGGLHIHDTGA
jgi:hypothetical protein